MAKNEKDTSGRRYIAKIRKQEGNYGKFLKVLMENPDPKDEYYKGTLLWLDHETGEKYQVKSMDVKGVSDDAKKHGFINSICIDLNDKYHVKKLK